MTSKPRLSDDYIASLLAQDAAEFMKNPIYKPASEQQQKPDEKRKPNTRFLRNLIRETDGFNAALLKKERDDHVDRQRERGHFNRRERSTREHRRSRSRDRHGSHRSTEDRRHTRRSRSRSRSPSTRSRRPRRSRSRTRRKSRSRSKERSNRKGHRRSRSRSRERHRNRKERRARSSSQDPLDDIVGPVAPPKARGRGLSSAYGSGLDAKFDPSYDPSQDVHAELDEERDDWDNAIEALKDQQAWKRSQKDRMVAAGFTEKEIEKWEHSAQPAGGQSDLNQVRWSKSGEGREWDRGKVFDKDGNVQLKKPFS